MFSMSICKLLLNMDWMGLGARVGGQGAIVRDHTMVGSKPEGSMVHHKAPCHAGLDTHGLMLLMSAVSSQDCAFVSDPPVHVCRWQLGLCCMWGIPRGRLP